MKISQHANQLGPGKSCLAIGVFDGVHLGHQQVIRQTVSDAISRSARAVVVTFDRHPNTVVAPDRVPPMIQTLPQRLRVIGQLGVHATLALEFTPTLSQVSGTEFVRRLCQEIGPIIGICVGRNFTFGHRRSGNVELLQTLGQEFRFQVHGLAALALDGIPVSSTRIRQALHEGQLDLASQLLGRPYSLCGQVAPGDKLGRQLGFPTANLEVAGLALPSPGVYAIWVRSRHTPSGQPPLTGSYRGVVNIGTRPTLGVAQPPLRVEAHLLDFDGELYGHELELTFTTKLREEQKFGSLDALKEQIQRDIDQARAL